ncbi:hypothetical protein ACRDNQ_17340 [Palleronia sp. KMU-117]|uniref:hypothetical protein n=1 Tax=Palleronia sp. KMU-117 TaxID=3434108 RepID=UPI003D7271DA
MTHEPKTARGNVTNATHAHHAYILQRIGPMPRRTLAALEDYGLDDVEIARYLGLSGASLGRLRRTLGARRAGPLADDR